MFRLIKFWIDCRLFKKHRYDLYTNRCIVCNKLDRDIERHSL